MQSYTFPYLGYFQLIKAVDKYILYDRLMFIKEAWMNRNKIRNAGTGSALQFMVPLEGKSSNSLIKEVKIFSKYDWRKKILNSIYLNYRKAPEFEAVYELLEDIINFQTHYIAEFNNHSIIRICRYLGIDTQISTDESYFDELESKLIDRETYFPRYDHEQYPAKVLRVFEICRREKANVFYNAIGGTKLYNKDLFSKEGLKLGFIHTNDYNYEQGGDKFLSGLSIIDIMMYNSPDERNRLLDAYTIV
jgi:hypothetical protein